MKNKLLIILLFVFSFVLMILSTNFDTYKYFNRGSLIISEIISSNNSYLIDNGYYDAVEVYNGYDYDVNLYGYYLSDEDNFNRKWIFPDVTIKSNEYLIIACSGKSINGDVIHTNFKLSKNGGVVTLADSNDKILSKIRYDSMIGDTSYGIDTNGNYVYYYVPSLGSINSGDFSINNITSNKSDVKLEISEFSNNNVSLYKTSDNKYYSLAEIYNYGDSDINLSGFSISNSDFSYSFGDVNISSNSFLIVFFSGLDKVTNDGIHTSFKVNDSDNLIVLKDKHNNVVDRLHVNDLGVDNVAFKFEDKVYYGKSHTFGKINNVNNKLNDVSKSVIVNEVSNNSIELYNMSDKDINLSSYKIVANSYFTILPSVVIKSHGYLVLYESDKYSFSNNMIYLGFKIGNSEDISLFDSKNNLIDNFKSGLLLDSMSYGIFDGNRVMYLVNSIGKSNSSSFYKGISNNVSFSNNDLYVSSGTVVHLECDGRIYYTLDNSNPTHSSSVYSNGITIKNDTTVKAICSKKDFIDSSISSRTYLVKTKHSLPVVSISAPIGDINSLFNNWSSNIERKVNFSFYDELGNFGTSFFADMGFSGADSRLRPQKSLALYLRSKYGTSSSYYPFFKGDKGLGYSSFTLRNSGEDPNRIRIQDTALTYLLKGKLDIDMQSYRSVVVYINNSYYGLYNMRERLNNDYLYTHYGVNKSDVDLIKYSTAKSGSTKEYNNLVNYIKNNDCSKDSVYKYIETRIDIDSLIDYFIVESFYGNSDAGNIRYWLGSNNKLRFMLYDLDWGMWRGFRTSSFVYPVINDNLPTTYLYSSINITRNLYTNKTFREKYISRFAELLNSVFKPSNFNTVIDELASEIESEITRHNNRWNDLGGLSSWKSNIKTFKNTYLNRYNYVYNNFKSKFKLSSSEYDRLFKG